MDFLHYGVRQGLRFHASRCAHDQMFRASEKPGKLLEGNINLRVKTCIWSLAQHISGNSHYGKPWALASNAQHLASWIFARPVVSGLSVVHGHAAVAAVL